jgi:hypothetical protein
MRSNWSYQGTNIAFAVTPLFANSQRLMRPSKIVADASQV